MIVSAVTEGHSGLALYYFWNPCFLILGLSEDYDSQNLFSI